MDCQLRFPVTISTDKIEYVYQGYLHISPTSSSRLEVICQSHEERNTAGRQGFLVMLNKLSHYLFMLLDISFGNSHKLSFSSVIFF